MSYHSRLARSTLELGRNESTTPWTPGCGYSTRIPSKLSMFDHWPWSDSLHVGICSQPMEKKLG